MNRSISLSSSSSSISLLLLILLVVVCCCCDSFVLNHHQYPLPISFNTKSSSSSKLHQVTTTSTTNDVTTSTSSSSSTTNNNLLPPMKIQDLFEYTDNSNNDNTMTKAQELYNNVIQTTYGRYPLTIKNGKGCYLYTTNDDEPYIDCVAGIATCALGHSNTYLTNAITEQMEQVHHVSNLYYIPSQAALAYWLIQNSVGEKVFFCNSGAEANEAAIKCARRYAYNRNITQPIIITAEQSFHGRTLGALSATGQSKYHKGFTYDGRMMEGFKFIPYNNSTALQEAILEIKNHPQQGLAGIMMEALQGEGGIIPGEESFFQTIRTICNEENALMICDEVQIGMGRSGKLWGYENLNIIPDIFTSAKALGGGVPIGAMIARGNAATVFGPGDHASTYGGNPLACSAGLAVAQYMYDHNVLQNVQDRHEQLRIGLQEIQQKYSTILGTIRGWGLLMGVEVIHETIKPSDIVQAAMDYKLLLVGAGYTMIRFVPPLIITEDEMKEVLMKFELAVSKVAKAAASIDRK